MNRSDTGGIDGTDGTDAAGLTLPGPGIVWALVVAVAHGSVVAVLNSAVILDVPALPGGPDGPLATLVIAPLAGVLLLLLVLTLGRWWRPAGLLRLRPTEPSGTRDAVTVVLPLTLAALVGFVVGLHQVGFLGVTTAEQLESALAAFAPAVLVGTVGSVLLTLALVPVLLSRGADPRGRSRVFVLLATAATVAIAGLVSEAVLAGFDPEFLDYLEPLVVARVLLIDSLVALPLVAVALRVGSPWLLAPALLLVNATFFPGDVLLFSYLALGVAYAVWVVLTDPTVRGGGTSTAWGTAGASGP